jgi:hypothetical protein
MRKLATSDSLASSRAFLIILRDLYQHQPLSVFLSMLSGNALSPTKYQKNYLSHNWETTEAPENVAWGGEIKQTTAQQPTRGAGQLI